MIDVTRATTALELVQFLDEYARRQGLNLDQIEVHGLEIRDTRKPAPPPGTAYLAPGSGSNYLYLHPNCPPDCIAGWDL